MDDSQNPIKKWIKLLSEYEYEGHKLHVHQNLGSDNIGLDFNVRIHYNLYSTPLHGEIVSEKIKQMLAKANRNFERYHEFVTETRLSRMAPTFDYNPDNKDVFITLSKYIDPTNFVWETYKKLLDKFFYITKMIVHILSYETTEIESLVVSVNRVVPKNHPWINPKKWHRPILENQEDISLKQWVENLRNYEYKGDDFVLKNPIKAGISEIDDEDTIIQINDSVIISFYHSNYEYTDHIEKIVDNANKHFVRHLEYITGFTGRRIFKHEIDKFQIVTWFKRRIRRENIKKPNHSWKEYKKFLDKYYFMMEQMFNMLAKDKNIEDVKLIFRREVVKERESIPVLEGIGDMEGEEGIRLVKQAKEKLDTYTYTHEGKAYKPTEIRDETRINVQGQWQYVHVAIKYASEIVTDYAPYVKSEVVKILDGGNKNLERFLKHHNIPTMSAFRVFRWIELEKCYIVFDLTINVMARNIKEKTVEGWWNSFKKALDKTFYIYFALLEATQKVLEKHGANPELEKPAANLININLL